MSEANLLISGEVGIVRQTQILKKKHGSKVNYVKIFELNMYRATFGKVLRFLNKAKQTSFVELIFSVGALNLLNTKPTFRHCKMQWFPG